MTYVPRFYFIPRDNDSGQDNGDNVVLSNFWKFEGTSLDGEANQLRFKKILGILNKMTPKKLQKLLLQISPQSMNSSYVKMLAEVIFSKVLDDEIYVNLYAKLCEEIMSALSTESLECFRGVIVDLCETGFNHLLQLTDLDISLIDEDRRYVYKRRYMTLMRFIGEMSCIDNAVFDESFNCSLTERLIDMGEEVHLEAMYYLLFTCSLRNNHQVWPEAIEREVVTLSKGYSSYGDDVPSAIKFKFMALLDHRNGLLNPSYYDKWFVEDVVEDNDSLNVDDINDYENFQFFIVILPKSKNDDIMEIVESNHLNVKRWVIFRKTNLGSSVQLTFLIDPDSCDLLKEMGYKITYGTRLINFKKLDTTLENELSLRGIPWPLNESLGCADNNVTSIKALLENLREFRGDCDSSSDDDSNYDDSRSDVSDDLVTESSNDCNNDLITNIHDLRLSSVENVRLAEGIHQNTSESIRSQNISQQCIPNKVLSETYLDTSDKAGQFQTKEKPVIKVGKNIENMFIKTEPNLQVQDKRVTCKVKNPDPSVDKSTLICNNVKSDGLENVYFTATFPDSNKMLSSEIIMELANYNNPDMGIKTWKVCERANYLDRSVTLVLAINCKYLMKLKYRLTYKTSSVCLMSVKDKDVDKVGNLLKRQCHDNYISNERKIQPLTNIHDVNSSKESTVSDWVLFQGTFPSSSHLTISDILMELIKSNCHVNIKNWDLVELKENPNKSVSIIFSINHDDSVKFNNKLLYKVYAVVLFPVDRNYLSAGTRDIKGVRIENLISGMESGKKVLNDIKNESKDSKTNLVTDKNKSEVQMTLKSTSAPQTYYRYTKYGKLMKFPSIQSNHIVFQGLFTRTDNISNSQILDLLKRRNPTLEIGNWKIIDRIDTKPALITFTAPKKSLECLCGFGFKINYEETIISLEPFKRSWDEFFRSDGSLQSVKKMSLNDSRDAFAAKVAIQASGSGGNFLTATNEVVGVLPLKYPSELFSSDVMKDIELKFMKLKTEIDTCNYVEFNGFRHLKGWMLILCGNFYTVSWLFQFVGYIDTVNFCLVVGDDIPRLSVMGFFPSIKSETIEEILLIISRENELDVSQWKIVKKTSTPHNGYLLTFSVDSKSCHILYRKRNSLLYKGVRVHLDWTVGLPEESESTWIDIRNSALNNYRQVIGKEKQTSNVAIDKTYASDKNPTGHITTPEESTSSNTGFNYKISDNTLFKQAEEEYTDYPNRLSNNVVFQAVFPNSQKTKTKDIVECLMEFNKDLNISMWTAVHRTSLNQGTVLLTFSADRENLKHFQRVNFQVFYKDAIIPLTTISDKPWTEELKINGANIVERTSTSEDKTAFRLNLHRKVNFKIHFQNCSGLKNPVVCNLLDVANPSLFVRKWIYLKRDNVGNDAYFFFTLSMKELLQIYDICCFTLSFQGSVVKMSPVDSPSWEDELSLSTIYGVSKTSNAVQAQSSPPVDSNVLFFCEFPHGDKLKNSVMINHIINVNKNLGLENWKITERFDSKDKAVLIFSSDLNSLSLLRQVSFRIKFKFHSLQVWLKDGRNWDNIFDNDGSVVSNVQDNGILSRTQSDEQSTSKCVGTSNSNQIRFQAVFPDSSHLKNNDIFKILNFNNSNLGINNWKVIDRFDENSDACLHFVSNRSHLQALKSVNFDVIYQSDFVHVSPLTYPNWRDALNSSSASSGSCSITRKEVKSDKKVASDQMDDKEVKFQATFPNSSGMKNSHLLESIANCNSKFGVRSWKIVERSNAKKVAVVVFRCKYKNIQILQQYQYKIVYQKHQIVLKPVGTTWEKLENAFKVNSDESLSVKPKNVVPLTTKLSQSCRSIAEDESVSDCGSTSSKTQVDRFFKYDPSMSGVRVAILPSDFPITLFTREEMSLIELDISDKLRMACESTRVARPRLNGYFKFGGWLLVLCFDKFTADWLTNLILQPWENSNFKIVQES